MSSMTQRFRHVLNHINLRSYVILHLELLVIKSIILLQLLLLLVEVQVGTQRVGFYSL